MALGDSYVLTGPKRAASADPEERFQWLIIEPKGCRDSELFTQVLECSSRYLLVIPGETTFDLEELQKDGKTETSSVCSLEEELSVCTCQGPIINQILFFPALLHLISAFGLLPKGGLYRDLLVGQRRDILCCS